jgi:hypothetical protein
LLVLAGPSMSCSGTAPTAATPLPSRSPTAKLGQRLQGQAGASHHDPILRLQFWFRSHVAWRSVTFKHASCLLLWNFFQKALDR